MTNRESTLPTNPERVRAFARFFKNYMSISSLVVASLPIPVTAMRLIPTYKAQTYILSVYTPLFCFLTLGFIFYIRHSLARAMFSDYWRTFSSQEEPEEPIEPDTDIQTDSKEFRAYQRAFDKYRLQRYRYRLAKRRELLRRGLINSLPIICILGAFSSTYAYHYYLTASVSLMRDRWFDMGRPLQLLLDNAELDWIPLGTVLMILYIAIFVFAEASFILMAIKEYLQDLMGYTEKQLIFAPYQMKKIENVSTGDTTQIDKGEDKKLTESG